MAKGMFKKLDIDRDGPNVRLMPNCKFLVPPYFSILTTFQGIVSRDENFLKILQIKNSTLLEFLQRYLFILLVYRARTLSFLYEFVI